MKRRLKYFYSFICAVLLFSTFSLAFGQSVNASETNEQPLLEEELLSENSDFVKLLEGIEKTSLWDRKTRGRKSCKVVD